MANAVNSVPALQTDRQTDGHATPRAQDFIQQYMASENSKFGREMSPEEAARDVDAWLLKYAG